MKLLLAFLTACFASNLYEILIKQNTELGVSNTNLRAQIIQLLSDYNLYQTISDDYNYMKEKLIQLTEEYQNSADTDTNLIIQQEIASRLLELIEYINLLGGSSEGFTTDEINFWLLKLADCINEAKSLINQKKEAEVYNELTLSIFLKGQQIRHYQRENAELNGKIELSLASLESAKDKEAQEKSKIDDIVDKLDEAKNHQENQINALKESYKTEQDNASEDAKPTYEDIQNSAATSILALESTIGDQSLKIEELTADNASLQANILTMSNNIDSLQKELEIKSETLKDAESKFEEFRLQSKTASDTEVDEFIGNEEVIQNEVTSLQEKESLLLESLSDNLKVVSHLEMLNHLKSNKIREMEYELKEFQAYLEQAKTARSEEISSLMQKLNDNKEAEISLRNKLEETLNKIEENNEEIKELTRKINEAEYIKKRDEQRKEDEIIY
ncbi:unnamed protein product [Blepharisma stoltei]|uniref:Uncharacterized protein n=1 Tax=Blepharisma stoltei TaxID=1481888 RepID=A0AAU9J4Z4_9CILI|nr:unnamed protein product [Blepharisma stoltei]